VTVLVQEVWEERVSAARPMRLVAETPVGALLWFPHRTRWRGPTTPDGPKEDELAIFARRGIVDPDLERRIRAEADAIVAKLERREPPFDGSFEDWGPDADWPALVLPEGWEDACR
jgi:hypothetical protein